MVNCKALPGRQKQIDIKSNLCTAVTLGTWQGYISNYDTHLDPAGFRC